MNIQTFRYLLMHEIAEKNKDIKFAPRKVDDRLLVIYGAGNLGKMAKQYFDMLGIPVYCVVDEKPEHYITDLFWKEIVLLPDDIPDRIKESALLAVCVVTSPYSDIVRSLSEQGWKDIVPFYDITGAYRDRHPLNNGWFATLTNKDLINIDYISSQWADDISRAHYLQFIAWHCLREERLFKDAPVTTDNRYFIPEVLAVLHDHEVYVDIGSYHGEVIQRFIQIVKNKFDRIYAFEPDMESFSNLYSSLKENIDEKFHLTTRALGDTDGYRRFYGGLGYSSQFSGLGSKEADVVRLDDLEIPATFIKIHVEGWEGDVIRGGMETLLRRRPILVVTSYHNSDGLWKLPVQIMDYLDEDYVYYFRMHSYQGTGAVIYAIPQERYTHGGHNEFVR